MAVMQNSLIFGDVNSADYGIYISGEGVFNAPKRDVEMISIPGRNGTFALDKGRFENIEVTYPAITFEPGDYDAFARNLADFRNAICSLRGYQRLTDTFHPEEYRMATYIGGLDIKPIKYNTASQFNLVFDCKPQRWLTSGEEAVTIGEYVEVAGTDNEPYLFRASPQFSDEYDTEIDKIVGGTVAWNQIVQNGDFADTTGWTGAGGISISASGNVLTATVGGSIGSMYYGVRKTTNFSASTNGHKIFITADINAPYSGAGIGVLNSTGASNQYTGVANTWSTVCTILNFGTGDHQLQIYVGAQYASYVANDTFKIRNCMCFDLTQMFGSTIADYIYSLETATAGAGVAWFRKLFNKPYYAYNAGELKSVSGLVSHDMVGFNAWDEEWESGSFDETTGEPIANAQLIRAKNYIPILPSTSYCFHIGSIDVYVNAVFYDADKNIIELKMGASGGIHKNTVFTTPSNARYMRFSMPSPYGTTYKNDICINISWDGSRNGEYEPYVKHSYPLESDLTLRGIPKLDADNKLYYDGDTYESDGTVTRKYGIRAYQSGDESLADAITDGTNTVYKLTTPTTETADPYTNPQIVDAYGTEEYVSTSIVPVGHDTQYGENPNVLVNPTLFESSPLLEVEGYGNIEFNGYEIELGSNEIGEILIADATSGQTTVTFDTSRLLSGDDINAAASAPYLVGAYVTISGAEGYYVDAPYQKTTTNFIYGSVSRSSGYFDYGVPETPWDHGAGVSSHMIYNGNGEYINKQAFFNFRFILAYDGADTLNISYELRDQVNMEYITVDSVTFLTAPIYGESSKTIERAYIDCELGEAYCIDGGSIISLNQRVDLGSDLPKLASGANEITYDNTITSLKVHPRWWKV